MGFVSTSSTDSSPRERVVVVIDANRTKGSVEAVDWALKRVVRPKDTVVVLGVLHEFGKKTSSCLPFHMSIGISGIWERLELSGQGEVNPKELEEEIENKIEQLKRSLQPFYRQCKKNEIKLEVKLAAGLCPREITIEEAQYPNTRWIVLDSHFKKGKLFMYGHVGCNIAVMKGKDFATLMPPKATKQVDCSKLDVASSSNEPENLQNEGLGPFHEMESYAPSLPPQSSCWYPLAWRHGFPREFCESEVDLITNGFAEENIIQEMDGMKVYQGILQEVPVLVKCFSKSNEKFWSVLNILSRVRHRNIMNLVGYCCSEDTLALLFDFPCMGTLDCNLQCDDLARHLSWKRRWNIALEIGRSLRYLHEECVDGPILHGSVCSSNVAVSHCCLAMLSNFFSACWLKDDVHCTEDLPAEIQDLGKDEDKDLSRDVRDYGMILLELITGKSAHSFQDQDNGQSLIDWALPLLENGFLREVMDPRLTNTFDSTGVEHIARAAFLCLKNDSAHMFCMSQVLAVVRGDQLATAKCESHEY